MGIHRVTDSKGNAAGCVRKHRSSANVDMPTVKSTIAELRCFRTHPAAFPFESVTRCIQSVGKHFLPADLLAELVETRDACAEDERTERRFLDCVLDKHDDRYRYESYLTLPVLRELTDGPHAPLDPAELAGLLVADVVRFEASALHGRHDVMP